MILAVGQQEEVPLLLQMTLVNKVVAVEVEAEVVHCIEG
jgi:hypothetical protein